MSGEHDHSHAHIHSHTHDHTHSHVDPENVRPVDETIALLEYMCSHNLHHAEELSALAPSLSETAFYRLEKAIGVFDAANSCLSDVLEQVKTEAAEENHDDCDETPEHDHEHDHEHQHEQGHVHDPAEKRREIARLSRVIGHLEYVRRMLQNDEDCSDVLMQITAAKSALNGLAKAIIGEHMNHCIIHAIEEGDTRSVEDFQKAIQRYL